MRGNHPVKASLDHMLPSNSKENTLRTADYVAEQLNRSSKKVKELFIYPAMHRDLVYKHFDRLSPGKMTHEEHLFYEESKMSYRVRYALTQKARLLIQKFYTMLED